MRPEAHDPLPVQSRLPLHTLTHCLSTQRPTLSQRESEKLHSCIVIVSSNEIFDSIFLITQTEQVVFMYVATTNEKRSQELGKD